MQSWVRILPEAQRPDNSRKEQCANQREGSCLLVPGCPHRNTIWPDDSNSSVTTRIETNSTVLRPMREDIVYGQCMVTIKEGALSSNTSHRVHRSPSVPGQTSHPYTKAAGRLPVQSGVDRFCGLGAKLRNKNKEVGLLCLFQHCTMPLTSPPNEVQQGRKTRWGHLLTGLNLKPKRGGDGRGVFFLGTWTGFKSTAQTVTQPHWSLTQPLHWPVSPFPTGDDRSVCVFYPQSVRKADQEPIWTAPDNAVEAW